MKSTRGKRKSLISALAIISLVVVAAGTGIANAATKTTHPNGSDTFTVETNYITYCTAKYNWESSGRYYCSKAQVGWGSIKSSGWRKTGTASVTAKGLGTTRAYYNYD